MTRELEQIKKSRDLDEKRHQLERKELQSIQEELAQAKFWIKEIKGVKGKRNK